MGLATHLGPWLLGTRRSTVGSSAVLGQVANIAPTTVGQSKIINFNDAALGTQSNAFAVPAGSFLTNVALYSAAGFTGTGTIVLTVYVGGVSVATQTLTTATAFAASLAWTAANAATLANIGTTDQWVTYAFTATTLTAGTGQLLVEYGVRNADGTYLPSTVTGP